MEIHRNIQKSILLIIICFVPIFAQENDEPITVLTNVMNRMKGIDQSYTIDMTQQQRGKPDMQRGFKSFIHWSQDEDIQKKIRMDYLAPKEMVGVIYWEYRMVDQTTKRWRTMPITGKLKDLSDLSDKSMKGTGFQYSDLEITGEMIQNHTHEVIGWETILETEVIVIDSSEPLSDSGKSSRKRLWIDPVNSIILKVIFFNPRGRELSTVECTQLENYNGLMIYKNIAVEDKKKKLQINITISDYSNEPIKNLDLFTPKGN